MKRMGLNGPDQRRTQKSPGPHSASNFEKAPSLRENNASGIQRYFEASNGQIFLPELPAPPTEILGKLLAIHFKSATGPPKYSTATREREV